MKTAVKWFIQEFEKEPTKVNLDKLAKQAIEMERQIIIIASEIGNDYDNAIVINGEEYYNKTFNN